MKFIVCTTITASIEADNAKQATEIAEAAFDWGNRKFSNKRHNQDVIEFRHDVNWLVVKRRA